MNHFIQSSFHPGLQNESRDLVPKNSTCHSIPYDKTSSFVFQNLPWIFDHFQKRIENRLNED